MRRWRSQWSEKPEEQWEAPNIAKTMDSWTWGDRDSLIRNPTLSLSLSLFLDFRFAFNQTQIMFSAWFREFGALGLKRWWVQIRNQGSFWLRFSTGLILNNIVKSMRASLSRKFNADEEWVLQWKLCWALIIFL